MVYTISIMDILPESIMDGDRIRTVIFCAGCDFKCNNCHNPTTWDINNGYDVPVQEVYDKLNKRSRLVSGITFSGGEPMLQAKSFLELAKMIKANLLWTIWCYTGYTFEEIIKDKDDKYELLKEIDILVDGRYIHELRDFEIKYRGSRNQRIIDVQESLKEKAVMIIEDKYFSEFTRDDEKLAQYRKKYRNISEN
jgi:anaerobic ribonucleoside-triphosphate reductase activating protein